MLLQCSRITPIKINAIMAPDFGEPPIRAQQSVVNRQNSDQDS